MRFSRLLPFAAAAVLAACNPQSADKTGAARAPIPPAQPSAPTAAAVDCPKVCPPAKASKTSKASKAVAHRKARVHKAAAHKRQRTYRRYEALAGGPPLSGREYARVPQDYYDEAPAVTYRYGPAYPPAGRAEEYEDWRGEERRYRRHHYDHDHGMDRRDERRWDGPPPVEDRYGPDRGSRWEGGSSYSERYSRRDYEPPREPPRPEYGHGERRSYEGRRHEEYSGRYEERRESSTSHETRESRSWSSDAGCCRSEAAGFDQNGFLTWPGKVPARP